ncbi:hypothetical protein AGMMS50262_23140 [Bacteroidia bacterium]|nr:hypothetical protein AGMMS50262_23140 [Bacteroidia bacterium]
MKTKILMSLLLIFNCLLAYSQERNYGQELTNLSLNKQIPEAMEFYEQYKDSISHPFATDAYHLMTAIYYNQQDSVDALFPSFIDKYSGSIINDDVVRYLKEYIRLSKMQITNETENNGDIHIPILTKPVIIFNAEYNGIPLNTVFDTGGTYPIFATKDIAEKIGLQMLEEYAPRALNDIKINAANGRLDSIRVGKLLLTNVPITVIDRDFSQPCIPDSLLSNKEVMAKMDSIYTKIEIIMGLPLIQLLHHIQFDLDKEEMIISFNHPTDTTKTKNIFLASDRLFLNTQINGLNFTAFIDTGGNWGDLAVAMQDEFYQQHKDQLPVLPPNDADRTNEYMIHGAENMPFIRLSHSTMLLGNQSVDLGDDAVIFADRRFYITKDGYVGLGLLKKLKKFTFDFDAMRLDVK